jgi:hypothetical protein
MILTLIDRPELDIDLGASEYDQVDFRAVCLDALFSCAEDGMIRLYAGWTLFE